VAGPPIKADLIWYTDGSKTDQGVGAGIYGDKPRTKINLGLGQYPTVFQAEIVAIEQCAREIIRRSYEDKTIVIYSDSQAAIRALSSCKISSKLVRDCVIALEEVGASNKLTIAWVPGHEGHEGNEEADKLAKEGAGRTMVGPEPYCGIPSCQVRSSIRSWIVRESQDWWMRTPGQRQAKVFIKAYSPEFTKDLLNYNRKAVRIIVGQLTGHCRLNKHLETMGLAEENLCRFCQEEEETAEHVWCYCEALCRLRFARLGEEKPKAAKYTKGPVSSLWSLIKQTGLDSVL
jgi:ribonuclease HI